MFPSQVVATECGSALCGATRSSSVNASTDPTHPGRGGRSGQLKTGTTDNRP